MSATETGARAMSFPGESDEYRRARNDLLAAELELRRQAEAVAEMRRALPPGGPVPTDYEFTEWDSATCGPRTVRFSELFAPGTDTLFIYSFMFNPDASGQPLRSACPMCTSMMDGLDGEIPHITQNISFAAASKAPIEVFHTHAHSRGWRNFRLVSTAGATYSRDYRAEDDDTRQRPIATVFTRRDGAIRHFWSSELVMGPADPGQNERHIDFMWPLWAVLDTTPDGRRPDWYPSLAY
jgi:predicted dithiol-disulfide oxidoreductase (DUF899 family)